MLARRDSITGGLDDAGQVPWLESRGVELIRGHGRLDGERRVRVGDAGFEAERAVVIATGSTAAIPPISGLAELKPRTNREITTTSHLPKRLLVLGGGAVGVEMANAFTSLGSRVTIVERMGRLIGREEPFAYEELRSALRERGVEVRFGVSATAAGRDWSRVWLELSDGETLEADELLVATGRRAWTEKIGLETVGLAAGDYLAVDEHLRVPGHPWLFAIGDVNGRSLLTHVGKRQAAVVADILTGVRRGGLADHGPSPRVIFTDPQVASVGFPLEGALGAGLRARAYDVPSSGTAGASFYGRGTPGTSRLVVDERRGVVVGATFTGSDVAEWLHAATLAVVSRIPVERLWDAVPAFPTRREVWPKLLEQRETELARQRSAGSEAPSTDGTGRAGDLAEPISGAQA